MIKNIAILDCCLGDSGKGSITHYLSPSYDFVVRAQGSENCGHQVYRDGKKYTHHYLPSVDYRYSNIKSFLASGMFINPDTLLAEIQLACKDFPGVGKTIYVDMDAFVITPEHIRLDKENSQTVGSTYKGVSPCAVSKYGRTGTRLYNLINDNAEVIQKLKGLGVSFTTVLAMREEFEKASIIFEGSQGALLDINSGLYPNITSSDCGVSGISASGFHFIKLDRVYGLLKPYLTRSGAPGPLPTEMSKEDGDYWREVGKEIGSTTGLPRRMAYLDLPMLRYGILKGGITHLIITKMDIMDGQRSIRTCISYGKPVYSPNDFRDVKPEYLDLPGWKDSKDPTQTRSFLKYVESYTDYPIEYISTGIKPGDIIHLQPEKNQTRLTDPFGFSEN